MSEAILDLFEDVEPIPQYEGGVAPIAPIPYPEHYVKVMGIFRAILAKEEVSKRAYLLTGEVIDQSEGNYTAWFYRRKMIDLLKLSYEDEMAWLRGPTGLGLEKNYQIWHHRRCIAEVLGAKNDFDAEIDFLRKIFESDCKNYHAWSYRIWLVERFSLWEGELEYAESLLDKEVTNNSAWSYRYFLLNRQPNNTSGTLDHVSKEITYLFT